MHVIHVAAWVRELAGRGGASLGNVSGELER